MLTKDTLQQRLDNIKKQVDDSATKGNAMKSELEAHYGNHNALLGAQMLAQSLLDECAANDNAVVTPPQAREPEVIDGATC